MRSLGWIECRYICKHRAIMHKAILIGFPEYLSQSIIIQSSNISCWKCHVMQLVQHSLMLYF